MNIQALLKQAQQMQNNIAKVEKELDALEFEGSVGGAIKVVMNGALELQQIDIDPELLKSESKEELEDMIKMAINNIIKDTKKVRDERMSKITQGVKIPGMM